MNEGLTELEKTQKKMIKLLDSIRKIEKLANLITTSFPTNEEMRKYSDIKKLKIKFRKLRNIVDRLARDIEYKTWGIYTCINEDEK